MLGRSGGSSEKIDFGQRNCCVMANETIILNVYDMVSFPLSFTFCNAAVAVLRIKNFWVLFIADPIRNPPI